MATIKRKQYGLVETNHVSAVRTGNMKAQYPMDAAMTAGLENGMGVTVDDENKLVKFVTAVGAAIYLHASEEQIYEEHLGRNSFKVVAPKIPRVLKLEIGDIFETNAVKEEAIVKGDVLYPGVNGLWEKSATAKAAGRHAVVVSEVTLPNGEAGFKLAIA